MRDYCIKCKSKSKQLFMCGGYGFCEDCLKPCARCGEKKASSHGIYGVNPCTVCLSALCDDCRNISEFCSDACEYDFENRISIRCVICGWSCTSKYVRDNDICRCPNCGHEGVPCDPKNDVNIIINWHELRILTMFAEKWVGHSDDVGNIKAVASISKRLRAQYLEKPGLLLVDDLNELKCALPDSEITVISGIMTAEDLEIPDDMKLRD
jgi:hypothetical protein